MDYLRKYINTQSINDYEKADIFLNIFFTGINFLLIVITVALFSSEKQEITDLSYQLIGIYFVNIIVRLYHIYILVNSTVLMPSAISFSRSYSDSAEVNTP